MVLDEFKREIKWLRFGAAAAVLAIALSVTVFFFSRVRAPTTSRSPRPFPLTGNSGLEISPAFSPDGQQIAYSWDGNRQNMDIYVKPMEGGEPRRLTDNAAHDLHPSWSPDGKRIAFLRVFSERSQIVIIPATGGAENIISETSPPIVRWRPAAPQGNGGTGPFWSRDGKYLLAAGDSSNTHARGVLKTYLDGRQEILTAPPASTTDSAPTISPSGNAIAFLRTSDSSSTDIFVMESGMGSKPVQLTFNDKNVQGLTWSDDEHLLYSSDQDGNFRLWQIARGGGRPQPFSSAGTQPRWPAISADGHWLAFVEARSDANIWQLPLDATGVPEQAEPFISSAGANDSPAYSPDGKRVVFVSDRSGARQLWLAQSDGTEIQQLTDLKASTVGTPRWSPDNRRIVFDASVGAQSALWLTDVDGNNLHRLNSSSAAEYGPSWSRDGQWVYFTSFRGGTEQLWKQRLSSGEPVQITKDAFLDAAEFPPGYVTYVQRRQDGIWQIPSWSGMPMKVPELAGVNPARYWTVADDKLYYIRQDQPPRELGVFDLKTRRVRKLIDIQDELLTDTPGVTVRPGSHSLLFVQKSQRRSRIVLQER